MDGGAVRFPLNQAKIKKIKKSSKPRKFLQKIYTLKLPFFVPGY